MKCFLTLNASKDENEKGKPSPGDFSPPEVAQIAVWSTNELPSGLAHRLRAVTPETLGQITF